MTVKSRERPVTLADKELWDVEDPVKLQIDRQRGGHQISPSTKRDKDMLDEAPESSSPTSPTPIQRGPAPAAGTRRPTSPSSPVAAVFPPSQASNSSHTLSAGDIRSIKRKRSEHGTHGEPVASPEKEGQKGQPRPRVSAAASASDTFTPAAGMASNKVRERPAKLAKKEADGKNKLNAMASRFVVRETEI